MTQYSMACNSSDYLSGKPDARTGLFAKTFTLANLKGNYQAGPSFKLQLVFEPRQGFINDLTPFGSGWGFSIPSFQRSSDFGDGHLTLPSGKSFYLPELLDGQVSMEGYLLSDVQIFWDSHAWELTVKQKNGDTHLYTALPGDQSSGNLYLATTTTDDGRSLYFSYENSTFNVSDSMLVCLTEIIDDSDTMLVSIDYSGAAANGTVITLNPDSEDSRQYQFLQEGNSLVTVYGPEMYQADFTYYDNNADGGVSMYLLSTVADTEGLYEEVTYSEASDPASGGLTLPGGVEIQNTVQIYRRAGDLTDNTTDYIANYSYPTPGANQYNYLGNPVIPNSQIDERTDSLLHYDGMFNYTCQLTEQVQWPSPESLGSVLTVNKVTTSTYNKFHSLVVKVITFSGGSVYDGTHTLTETLTYAATDGDITQQIPTYTLPLTNTKTWSDGSETRSEIQEYSWDDFANLLSQTDESGVMTTRTYYSAAGEMNCPADPYGFVGRLKQKVVTPGVPTADDLPLAPVRQYDHAWSSIAGFNGSYPIRQIRMDQSQAGEDDYVLRKEWTWLDDASLLGAVRLASTATTLPAADGDKTTRVTYDYSLQSNNTLLSTKTTQTGYDGVTQKDRTDHSVTTGSTMASADITLSESAPVITVDYTYDAMQRLTQKKVCKGSTFEASQMIDYLPAELVQSVALPMSGLNPRPGSYPGNNPETRFTDVHGVQTRKIKDSSGNLLAEYRQDKDGLVTSDTTQFWQISQNHYDALGNQIGSTHYDWFPDAVADAPSIVAPTTSLFDVWGEQYATISSDGHSEIEQYDPLTLKTFKALSSSDGVQTQKQWQAEDVAGDTLSTVSLNADDSVYATETSDYDGLGRLARSIDAMQYVTLTLRDEFDRPVSVTRPDDSMVNLTWASHSNNLLLSAVDVVESSADSADSYRYGVRSFDGLDRVISMVVGGRQSLYSFSNGCATKPEKVTNPDGTIVTYSYQPELNDAVLSISSSAQAQEATLTFTYAHDTGDLLTSNSDIAADDYAYHSVTYTPSGRLKEDHLRYQVQGEAPIDAYKSISYSLGGLELTTTDVRGLLHVMSFDSQGRNTGYTLTADPASSSATLAAATYAYDSFGRQYKSTVTDSHSGNVQTTVLLWDDQGRESQRTVEVTGSVNSSLVQTLVYNLKNQITQRTALQQGQTQRVETYGYSSISQMNTYLCTGDFPDSPDGYRLSGQQFIFDFIGNITAVTSNLLDSTGNPVTNKARYTQDATDRTLLIGITNDTVTGWDATLSYDANGNMTHDEQQRVMTYNSRNQLMNLSDPQLQPAGWYRYDAHGTQIAEKAEADSNATTLYYQSSGVLMNERRGGATATYMNSLACLFQDGSGPETVQLLGCDQQGSVNQISDENEVTWRVYDPYGFSK